MHEDAEIHIVAKATGEFNATGPTNLIVFCGMCMLACMHRAFKAFGEQKAMGLVVPQPHLDGLHRRAQ